MASGPRAMRSRRSLSQSVVALDIPALPVRGAPIHHAAPSKESTGLTVTHDDEIALLAPQSDGALTQAKLDCVMRARPKGSQQPPR